MSADRDPQPTGDSLRDPADRYRGEQGEAYHRRKHAVPPQTYEWVAARRAENFRRYVDRSHRILEFGVGTGWNIAALECREKVGFDISEHLASELQSRGIRFVRSTSDLDDGSFDVVICHHVLEHLKEPSGALAEMHRLLAPGGFLLLHVPYEPQRRYRIYRRDEPNHHLFSWTPQTAGNLVAQHGFEIVEARLGAFGYDRLLANLTGPLGQPWIYRGLLAAVRRLRPEPDVVVVGRRTPGTTETA